MNMKKGKLMLYLCVVVFCGTTISIALNAQANHAIAQDQQHKSPEIPQAVIYSILFHYVLDVKAQAAEAAHSGKDPSHLKSYFRYVANLDAQQADALNRIAAECLSEVEKQDKKAREVINKFKTQFPGGKVPKRVQLPPPPPELKEMQTERDTILLQGRDKLRAALGENGFQNLDNFVKQHIVPRITITPVKNR